MFPVSSCNQMWSALIGYTASKRTGARVVALNSNTKHIGTVWDVLSFVSFPMSFGTLLLIFEYKKIYLILYINYMIIYIDIETTMLERFGSAKKWFIILWAIRTDYD